ncbi:MAG: PAS domain S-box protein [Bacteroidota bacterium]
MSETFLLEKSGLFYALTIDVSGRIVVVNDLFQAHFLNKEQTAIGKFFSDFIVEGSKQAFDTALATTSRCDSRQLLHLQSAYKHPVKDIEIYDIDWELSVIKKDGAVTGCHLIGAKSARQSITENRYKALFEQATDAIMITDFKGNFLDVNPWLCNMFGYSYSELLTMNINQLIDSEELKVRPIAFHNLAAGKHVFSERKMLTRGGDVIQVEANVKAVNEYMVLAIARDISERKQVEQEKEEISTLLKERIKELKTLYRCSQIIQDEHNDIDVILQSVADTIPEGYQYPSIAAARISIGNAVYKTSFFEQGKQSQVQTFKSPGGIPCSIEVVYTEHMPEESDGPFLTEEKQLLAMLADMLRIYLSRKFESDALIKSEANLQTIFNHTSIGFTLVDKDFKVVFFNQYSEEFSKNELKYTISIGMNLKEYFNVKSPEEYEQFVAGMKSGNILKYENSFLQEDGANNWYQTQIFPIINDESKGILGYTIAVTNITSQKENEIKIKQQLDVLSELSYITSHELRHEYTKLYSIIDMVNQTEHISKEEKMVLRKSQQILANMDKVIYKLNDQIVNGKFTRNKSLDSLDLPIV